LDIWNSLWGCRLGEFCASVVPKPAEPIRTGWCSNGERNMNEDIKGRIQELREKTEEMRGYL
jgi:hypothetical protein